MKGQFVEEEEEEGMSDFGVDIDKPGASLASFALKMLRVSE